MKWREHAELLAHKATQDEYLLDRMVNDPEAPVEAFGFHAQQAVEKLLKAVLALKHVEYPRTHRLSELLDLIHGTDVGMPMEFEELRELTAFAVEFRYDALPEEPEAPLNKIAIRERIRKLREWVNTLTDRSKP